MKAEPGRGDANPSRVPPHPPLAGRLERTGALALGRVGAGAVARRARPGRGGVLRGASSTAGERRPPERSVPAPRARSRDPHRCARRRPLLPAPARSGGGTRPASLARRHALGVRPEARRSLPHGAFRDRGIRGARRGGAALRPPGDAQPRGAARRLPHRAPVGLAGHRDRRARRRALLGRAALAGRRTGADGERGPRAVRRNAGGIAPGRERPALPSVRMVRRARPRPRPRVERGRVRSRLHRPALPAARRRVRHRARRRALRDPAAGVRVGHVRRPHPGARGARRDRHPAHRVLVVRIVRAGARGASDARTGQAHRAHRRPGGGDHPPLRARPPPARGLQHRGLPAGGRDRGEGRARRVRDAPGRADGARHGPAGRLGGRVRQPLSPASAPRGPRGPGRRRCAIRGGQPRGVHPRFEAGALRQRPGAGLQEPVSEHHPHLRHRPVRPARPGGGAHRRVPGRVVRARGRDPARPRAVHLGGARPREGARRRGDVAGDEDPDELLLRHPRRDPAAASTTRASRAASPGAATRSSAAPAT